MVLGQVDLSVDVEVAVGNVDVLCGGELTFSACNEPETVPVRESDRLHTTIDSSEDLAIATRFPDLTLP